MAFGLTALGFNNAISISSDIASMVFVGKAVRVTGTGLTYFPGDEPTVTVRCNAAGGTLAVCGGASFVNISLKPSDDIGIFTFEIASPAKPAVFIASTDATVFGSVYGIAASGATGANGWPVWYVKVGVSYPLGLRTGALPFLSVYCFTKIPDTPPTGYGIAVFNELSVPTFSSAYKPLKVKDIVRLVSTNTPANLADLVITKSYLADPVTPTLQVAKPAFLNVDWGRYAVTTTRNLGLYTCIRFNLINGRQVCVECGFAYSRWVQTLITGGMNVNATRTDLIVSLVGFLPGQVTCQAGNANSVTYTKAEALPVFVPVIDGAEYD